MKKPKLKEYALTGYIPPDYDDENYEEGDEGSYMYIHVLATSLEEANEILTDLEEDVFWKYVYADDYTTTPNFGELSQGECGNDWFWDDLDEYPLEKNYYDSTVYIPLKYKHLFERKESET